jgi:deazaflavin-dependent oxidoreductase (nitroreductase family)
MSSPTDEKIYDSPTRWVAKHIDEYVATDGARGQRWKGTDTLLLTTRGRKTGKLRRSALIYGKDGDDFVVVASKGGAPAHPAWYLNLRDEPQVLLQVGPDVFPGLARTVTGPERDRLWELMAGIWPDYDNYQKKTEREIPIVAIGPLVASG